MPSFGQRQARHKQRQHPVPLRININIAHIPGVGVLSGENLWVTLPEGIDAETLLPKAVEHKVAFVPGLPFFPCPDIMHRTRSKTKLPRGHNTMRLNFSNSSPDKIDLGIRHLGRVIEEAIAEQN